MKRLLNSKIKFPLIALVMYLVLYSAGSLKADYTFGAPTNLGPTVNPAGCPNISADGLELYMSSTRSGGSGQDDLWVTKRQTQNAPWGEPVNLGSVVNSSYQEWFSSISQDGLSLYFCSTRPGGSGGWDLWMTTRETTDKDWGAPLNVGQTVNSSADEYQPNILADGCTLLLCSTRPGGCGGLDIWITKRDTKNDPWGTPMNLGPPVNSPADDGRPSLSSDSLGLFFRSDRPGGFGGGDIWLTMRAATNAPWGEPINLGPMVNTVFWECGPSISRDGSTLYFHSNRPGGYGSWDLWEISIAPVVDLNGDGAIDAADMCIMVDHWGKNCPLCDIGPMPWGDGVVDVEDLKVLAEYLFEEVNDPTLIAHWPLDETEGNIACDNAADCDGTLRGGPVWQQEGGMVGGALLLDGIDDYVSTDPVLNPADGKFSVIAWIKGGVPGQAVLSQTDAANWLCIDSVEGCLTTELKAFGRGAPGPLLSQTVVTDGNWHRIALVWDGSYRHLYVDGTEVAMDVTPLSSLEDAYGGLYFGAGSDLTAGTFFSGLIDDVRIYNRVVHP